MEGCFTFQWGICFLDGGGFIFNWGVRPMGGGIGFDGGGGAPPPPTMGNPIGYAQIKVNEYQIDCKQRMTIQQ